MTIYPKGTESFLYICLIFFVDIVQDIFAGALVKRKTGIVCFSKYYGRAFTERTLMTALPAATCTMWIGGNLAQLGLVAQKLNLGPFSK